jgi:hypothetical protein
LLNRFCIRLPSDAVDLAGVVLGLQEPWYQGGLEVAQFYRFGFVGDERRVSAAEGVQPLPPPRLPQVAGQVQQRTAGVAVERHIEGVQPLHDVARPNLDVARFDPADP